MRFKPVGLAVAALVFSLAGCESMDLVWTQTDGGLTMNRYRDAYGAEFDEYVNRGPATVCIRDARRSNAYGLVVPAGKRVRHNLSAEHSGFINVIRDPAEIARCSSDPCKFGWDPCRPV